MSVFLSVHIILLFTSSCAVFTMCNCSFLFRGSKMVWKDHMSRKSLCHTWSILHVMWTVFWDLQPDSGLQPVGPTSRSSSFPRILDPNHVSCSSWLGLCLLISKVGLYLFLNCPFFIYFSWSQLHGLSKACVIRGLKLWCLPALGWCFLDWVCSIMDCCILCQSVVKMVSVRWRHWEMCCKNGLQSGWFRAIWWFCHCVWSFSLFFSGNCARFWCDHSLWDFSG